MGVLMPLQEQIIDVPIVGGLQQHEDERLTAAPQLLKNCRYNKGGTVSKRRGYSLLVSANANNDFLHTMGESLILSSKFGVTTYSPALTAASNIVLDRRATVLTSSVHTGVNRVTDVDAVVCNGYRVAFWGEATTYGGGTAALYYSITDTTSEEVVVLRTALADAGNQPQLVVNGTNVRLVYNLSTTIKCVSLDMTSPTTAVTGPTTLATGVGSSVKNCHHDTSTLGNVWVLAWQDSASSDLYVAKMTNTTVTSTYTLSPTVTTAPTSIACHYDFTNSRVWVAWDGDDGFGAVAAAYVVFSSTDWTTNILAETALTFYVGVVAQMRGIVSTSSTTAVLCYSSINGSSYGWETVTTSGISTPRYDINQTISGPHYLFPGFHFLSRPIKDTATGVVLALGMTMGAGNTYVFVKFDSTNMFTPIASFFPALSNASIVNATASPLVQAPVGSVTVTTDGYSMCFIAPADAVDVNYRTAAYLADINMDPKINTVEWGGSLFFSGGVPLEYDGSDLHELSVIGAPADLYVAADATAGSLAAVPYYYTAVPTILSRTNLIRRGSPSTVSTVTPTVNKSAKIYAPAFPISKTAGSLYYDLYRTLDTPGNYYRLSTDIPLTDMLNDLSVDYLDYVDSAASTSIDENPLLYTTGGILPNVQPPSARLLHRWNNRFWLADTNDGYIWYSKTLVPTECPAFTLAFTLSALDAGRVTGLSSFEDKLIVFYEKSIWAVFGDGPGDTGAGGTFNIQRIVDGLGCTDSRSIVQTPAGIMFQDSAGIHILGRDLVPSRIGAPIEDTMSTYSEVTSAVYVPSEKEVRFTIVASNTSSYIAVYDFEANAWSLDEPNDGYTSSAIKAAVIYQDKYTYLKDNGRIFQESASSYLDNGNFVTMTFETGEMHVNQIQGMQRVWEAYLLTKRSSAHGLTIAFYTDYSSSSSQSESFTEAVVTTAGTVGQFGVTLLEQECESLRIRVSDSAPAVLGTGQGCTITGITLCVGSEGKITKRVHTDQRK